MGIAPLAAPSCGDLSLNTRGGGSSGWVRERSWICPEEVLGKGEPVLSPMRPDPTQLDVLTPLDASSGGWAFPSGVMKMASMRAGTWVALLLVIRRTWRSLAICPHPTRVHPHASRADPGWSGTVVMVMPFMETRTSLWEGSSPTSSKCRIQM